MQFRLRNSQPIKVVERTSVSFSREDLMALARLVQAGQVLLADEPRPAVIACLKAAMTRLGLHDSQRPLRTVLPLLRTITLIRNGHVNTLNAGES